MQTTFPRTSDREGILWIHSVHVGELQEAQCSVTTFRHVNAQAKRELSHPSKVLQVLGLLCTLFFLWRLIHVPCSRIFTNPVHGIALPHKDILTKARVGQVLGIPWVCGFKMHKRKGLSDQNIWQVNAFSLPFKACSLTNGQTNS